MFAVSIIIPTYNRAHLISKAVNSIVSQNFDNWELIIVDDGSSDNTSEVVNPYLKDLRIKYVNKENSGAAHSRNVGVLNSTHDLITFLDSDDEAEPIWLERMVEKVVSEDADIVCCGLSRYDENGIYIKSTMPKKLGNLYNGITAKFTNGGSFLLKKEIFNAIGGYDNELQSGQHTELAFRLVPYINLKQLKIVNIFEPLIKINVHSGARIRTDYRAKYKGSLHTYTKHSNLFINDLEMKKNYEATIAYNAYRIGLFDEARKFGLKAFTTRPNFITGLRAVRYLIKLF